MMRVKMKVDVSGTRNGKDWPPRGEEMNLPDEEAVGYIKAGLAEAVTSAGRAKVETATMPDDEERRGPIKVGRATVGRNRTARKAAPAAAETPSEK